MCGISGIIGKKDIGISEAEIRRITDPVVHRGPDAEGYHFGRNFAFGHRRLSIIDLSLSANQPMIYKEKYAITYNGEIYNYIEIRADLIKKGYTFITDSDTEVILAAYDYYGSDCVNHFNGMWAFAIHDALKETIFCSRDRFGVKPFYYMDTPENFVFGSEIKQLLLMQDIKRVNIAALADFLIAALDEHSNQTFFEGISKLEQSHNLIYNLKNHSFYKYRYYKVKISKELNKLSEKQSIDYYKNLFTDSVKIRLRSDVKVGACLSGGLDSSSIVAFAASLYKSDNRFKFGSVTARSTEPAFDEGIYARQVSEYCNLDWHTVTPGFNDFLNDLSGLVRIQEEPFGSPSIYMQYKVFQKARETGCTVMLDGQGGDETLLGYERYYPAYLKSKGYLNFFKSLLAAEKNSNLSIYRLLTYYLYFTRPEIRYMVFKSKFAFVKPVMFQNICKELLSKNARAYRDITELQLHEVESVQLPHLLKYEDRNSMIHSIESRLPYLDYRLVEAALSINNAFKIKDGWTKYLLRRTVDERLPAEIAWRKNKIGFNAPEATWIGRLDDEMKKQVNSSEILRQISNKDKLVKSFDNLDLRVKWRLFNIAKWEEAFNVVF